MLERSDLIFPELAYQIVGCAYSVYNSIGGGHKESVYQKAMALALKSKGLKYREQTYYTVKFENVVVGRNFFDFYIEEKIVVELKSSRRFTKANYDQVLNYLNVSNTDLALLILFGDEGVRCKRVISYRVLNKNNK